MIYLVILLLLVFCVWYYDVCGDNKYKEIVYWALFVIFFLLSGLRYKIGIDTIMYMRTWDQYGDFLDFDWIHDIERFQNSSLTVERYRPAWILYCMLLRTFTHQFVIVQLVTSLLFNVALFRIIRKYSPYRFLTLLIFFISFKFLEFEFEIMRETVAVAFFLLISADAFIEKKWVRYYVGVTIAFLFHPSALMMFALPLVRNLKWSLRQYSLYLVLPGFILGVAGRVILGDLVNLFLGGGDFISEYTNRAFEQENNANYLIMYGLQPTLLYILSAFFFKRFTNKTLVPIVFFSIFFMYLGMFYYTAARLVNYIIILTFIAVTPLMMHIVKKVKTVWIAVVLMLIYFLPTLYSFTLPINVARYYPYHTWLDPRQTEIQKRVGN